MKLIFSIIAIFAMALPSINASNNFILPLNESESIISSDNNRLKIKIKARLQGEVGREIVPNECRGLGTACLGLVITITVGDITPRLSEPNTVVFIKDNDQSLTLEFFKKDIGDDNNFYIDEPYKLDPRLCKEFKNNSIVVKKGVYKIIKSESGNYSVNLPIEVR